MGRWLGFRWSQRLVHEAKSSAGPPPSIRAGGSAGVESHPCRGMSLPDQTVRFQQCVRVDQFSSPSLPAFRGKEDDA